jgi:aromatic ring-cleaving dioxygenase
MTLLPFNSKIRPANFPHHFDAHIYFEAHQADDINELRNKILFELKHPDIFVGNIITAPIGPHPYPMLEVNFSKSVFSECLFFLMKERKKLTILVHSISENDYLDHTVGAIWLGKSLELDLSKF